MSTFKVHESAEEQSKEGENARQRGGLVVEVQDGAVPDQRTGDGHGEQVKAKAIGPVLRPKVVPRRRAVVGAAGQSDQREDAPEEGAHDD